jgi:hypothetical protein
MMLACPSMTDYSSINPIETIVWSIGLLAPLATFLALPRLLPLGRELTWSRIKARLPLAWLGARAAGAGPGWRQRLREAWLRDVHDAHPEDTRRGEVVRDASLLLRARILGWIAGGTLLLANLLIGMAVVADGDPVSWRLALSLALTGLAMGWVGRVAGTGAGLWAQSMALGRSLPARLGAGLLVGAGYGAIGGFVVGVTGVAVVVPSMSLLTLEMPAAHETMIALTVAGVFTGFLGALFGSLILAPIAACATRRK